MKTWKIITIVGAVLVATALVTATAFAYMGGHGFYSPYGTNPATGSYGAYSGGMIGGYSANYQGQNGWGGCRGMNGYASPTTPTQGAAITLDKAVDVAKTYLASLNNPDLAIDEVEEYTQNFYVLFYEKSTGIGAFEMLIDKYTGSIYPEMGPNMMWNTKYGTAQGITGGGMMGGTSMGGMMGGYGYGTGTTMTITVDKAKTNAQRFLAANYPGTTVGSIDTFYGYYHADVLQAGNTYGMLSVNGYTGQVWYHTWHGAFVDAVEP
jgi:hypothetical protein